MKIHVDVTAQDIAAGKVGKCMSCPVALALFRAVRPIAACYQVSVSLVWLTLYLDQSLNRGSWIDLPTPPLVREFIGDFDDGKPVAPIAFDLDIPS